jgi:hypothetical protein
MNSEIVTNKMLKICLCIFSLYLLSFLTALPVVEKAVEAAENIHFVYVGVGDRD